MVSGNSYMHAMSCQAPGQERECTHAMWDSYVGEVSLSLVEPLNQID